MTNPPPSPGWAWWQETSRRYGPGPGSDIRVSDAERAAVSDLLSKHYADGRLDDAEFRDRLDRAMSAKTRGDLRGLTTDLPPLQPQQPLPVHHRHSPWPIAAAVVVGALVLSAAASAFTFGPHVPWLLVLIVGILVWRRAAFGSWHRHQHDHSSSAPPPY